MSQGEAAIDLEKLNKPKANKYESLYKLQYKACQILK